MELQKAKKQITKLIIIPQRYLLILMAFLATVNAYQMRVCLNVAITEMVYHERPLAENHTHYIDPDACPDPENQGANSTSKEPPPGTILFSWSEKAQGLILSSFYYGYVLSHIPAGLVADKFGGKYLVGGGLICSSLITLLTPVAAEAGQSWLILSRFIIGLGQGTTFPAVNNLLAKWIPLEERGFSGSFVYAGCQVGTITGTLISGYLLDTYQGEWQKVFYVFGGIGMIWSLAWFLLCYNSPEDHPFITEKEKKTLTEKILRPKVIPSPPWRSILTSLPLIALVIAQIGHDWILFTVVVDLPKYMKDVLKFSIATNGLVSSLPYVAMWLVGLSSGWLCDFLVKRKILQVTTARRLFNTIAHIVPAAGLIAASYAGCDRTVVVVLFCVSMGVMGLFYAGLKVNALDLSPNYSGTLMALVNGIGGVSGMISPYLVGVLTPNHTLMEWRTVYWIIAAVNIVTVTIFNIFSSGEAQPWNDVSSSNTNHDADSATKEENVFNLHQNSRLSVIGLPDDQQKSEHRL